MRNYLKKIPWHTSHENQILNQVLKVQKGDTFSKFMSTFPCSIPGPLKHIFQCYLAEEMFQMNP